MNYLVLYEAFESQILKSTLRYVKNKSQFLDRLEEVCNNIDYPYSNLSDDFFEYLPFKKALEKNMSVSDIPCDAKSSVFGEYEVPGEVCDSGKLKRKWGSRTRIVTCPVCNGSGVKKAKSDVKLIKFWFDVNGNYICTSAVDGVIRNGLNSKDILDTYDIEVIKSVSSFAELKDSVSTGDYILGRIGTNRTFSSKKILAYVVKEHNNHVNHDIIYLLNDDISCRGCGPINYKNVDTIFGKPQYSWAIGNNSDFCGEIDIVDIKIGVDVDDNNPYLHNVYFNGLYTDTSVNLKESLKKASFALILDLGKLKSSDYNLLSGIRLDRQILKKDAFLKDDDIKKANISRYLDKLSDVDVKEIKNINKLLRRVFGMNKNNYFYILGDYYSNVFDAINTMRNSYTRIIYCIENDNIDDANYLAKELNKVLKRYIRENFVKSNNINDNLIKLKSELNDDGISILNKISEVNLELSNQIDKFNLECVEDFNIFYNKLSFFKNCIRDEAAPVSNNSYKTFITSMVTESYKRVRSNLLDINQPSALKLFFKGLDSVKNYIKRY